MHLAVILVKFEVLGKYLQFNMHQLITQVYVQIIVWIETNTAAYIQGLLSKMLTNCQQTLQKSELTVHVTVSQPLQAAISATENATWYVDYRQWTGT